MPLTTNATMRNTTSADRCLALALGAAAALLVSCSGEDDSGGLATSSTTSPTGGSGGVSSSGGSGGTEPLGGGGTAGSGGGSTGGGGAGGQGGAAVGEGCITGSFTAYRGNFHAHTSYSDGAQEPADAFAYARDVAGLDIMVVTDHLEQLYWVPPVDRWGECLSQAAAADDPGSFVAHCGYEYGSGFIMPMFWSTGHNNVFFADGLFPAVQTDFHAFYATFAACSTCIGQFNHPGSDPYQTWSDFEYDAVVDERMNLFEFNGGGPVWDLFFAALDAGWHVSPMINQDNHSANWGTANDTRSGVYLSALDRDALRTAMLERRTFMSRDRDAAISLMVDDSCWMGSVLSGYGTLNLTLHASDAEPTDGFDRLELYGPGQALIATLPCNDGSSCDGSHSLPITQESYVVLRAVQTDGDELIAAPIWASP